MNTLEKQMVDFLKDLRDNHNVVEVKTEFESEAARLNEVMRLKDVVGKAGLGLVIKTGGAEAVRDMYDACLIGATGIVAPMIESAFALKKYLAAINTFVPDDLKDYIHFAINVETIQAVRNLDEILNISGIERLRCITVGRVDICGSLGLGRDDINSTQIFEITRTICQKSRAKGLSTTMGGGIAREALPFIKKLAEENLLDRFETRKIVFAIPPLFDEKHAEEGIIKANRFELMWLTNKRNYYSRISKEDEARIEMLDKRVGMTTT